jgi:glycosidase
MRFCLECGVDGFRLDVINFLQPTALRGDNPMKDGVQEHINDINQSGVSAAIKKIKSVVNKYENRFVVGEIGSDKIKILKQ